MELFHHPTCTHSTHAFSFVTVREPFLCPSKIHYSFFFLKFTYDINALLTDHPGGPRRQPRHPAPSHKPAAASEPLALTPVGWARRPRARGLSRFGWWSGSCRPWILRAPLCTVPANRSCPTPWWPWQACWAAHGSCPWWRCGGGRENNSYYRAPFLLTTMMHTVAANITCLLILSFLINFFLFTQTSSVYQHALIKSVLKTSPLDFTSLTIKLPYSSALFTGLLQRASSLDISTYFLTPSQFSP